MGGAGRVRPESGDRVLREVQVANHQCQGMSHLMYTNNAFTKEFHTNKTPDARTRRLRALALPPLRTEMARTVFHGSSRQQHHDVDAAVLQPTGDPDGLRRHAIPVKFSCDSDFLRLFRNVVVCFFNCKIPLDFFSYLAEKDFLFCIFLWSLLIQ